jgi:hypothetical protein
MISARARAAVINCYLISQLLSHISTDAALTLLRAASHTKVFSLLALLTQKYKY